MKKVLLLILLTIGLISCKNQGVNGVWMSFNDRVIDEHRAFSSGLEGMIIDFDKSEFSSIHSDSTIKFEKGLKEMKIVRGTDSIIYPYDIYKNDSIEIVIAKNTISVFRPLNLNNPLKLTISEIVEFLTVDCNRKFADSIKVKFLKDYHPLDRNKKKLRMVETIWNNSRPLLGHWSVSEINNNYFLFISIEDTTEKNIYQIISKNKNEIKLMPLKENYYKLRKLKTCL